MKISEFSKLPWYKQINIVVLTYLNKTGRIAHDGKKFTREYWINRKLLEKQDLPSMTFLFEYLISTDDVPDRIWKIIDKAKTYHSQNYTNKQLEQKVNNGYDEYSVDMLR